MSPAMLEPTAAADANSSTTPAAGEKRSATTAGIPDQNFRPANRAPKACQGCRARKVRCKVVERGAPCTNCGGGEVECVFTESKRQKKSRGTKVGNAGPASDTDSTVRGGKRHGAGLLRPSSSPSPHTGSMPAVPQHHAERPGFVKPSSIKMPADGLEQLHWSSEERRNEVELHRQRRRAILCTKKAEMAVQVCGLLSALHSDKSAKELDMEESELRLKLESLLPLLSQRDDANSPPPEIPLNSAGPSTISNSGTQQAREELPSPVERPTPPDLQDLPTPHMAPEGGNNGALGTLLTPPCGQGNGPFGQYGDVGHQGDASLLGQGSPDGSSWGLGLPENPTALMGDEEVGHFDADDVVVLETWTCNW